LKNCYNALDIIYDAIEEAASQVSQIAGTEGGKESCVLVAVVTAFETELDRMWQVLQWGYLTWRYDPAIREGLSEAPAPSIPEPETSPEAALPTN